MGEKRYEYIGRILETLHPSITIADKGGVFVYIGKSCEEFFGVSADQLLGKKVTNPEIQDIFRPCVTEMVYEKREKIVTVQKNLNGTETMVTGMPFFGDDGEMEMILVISSWEISSYEELKNSYNQLQLEVEELTYQLNRLSQEDYMSSNLLSKSKVFTDAVRILQIFADKELPAFVYGPQGCGKKHLTRVAYGKSELLYEYNCELLDDETINKELFGEQGLISAGIKKTLIVENIELLSPELQKTLISHLKRNGVVVVGIAEMSLEQLKEKNLITEEFYNYFESYQVQIVSMSERPEDVNIFINYYLDYFNKKYDRTVKFTPKAINALLNYEWVGNINEIKNTIERVVLTAETDRVDVYNLPSRISAQSMEAFTNNESLKDMLEFYEKNIITRTYKKYKTTVKVAEKLGISQPSAARKIKKYVNAE